MRIENLSAKKHRSVGIGVRMLATDNGCNKFDSFVLCLAVVRFEIDSAWVSCSNHTD